MSAALTCHDAALAHAAQGLRVLPLWWASHGRCGCDDPECLFVGKHPVGPLVPHGSKDGTTAARTINAWWDRYPVANVGVCTGSYSDRYLTVFDIDGEDGPANFVDLTAGEIPLTRGTRTGTGGWHQWYWSPIRVRNRHGLQPGIDVRGEGGYVVVAPSVHANGTRSQEQGPSTVAPIPERLAAALKARTSGRVKNSEPVSVAPHNTEDMTLWGGCEELVQKILADFGVEIGVRFDPPWRRPSEKGPSAHVYRDARGLFILFDPSKAATEDAMILPEFFAAFTTGEARRLNSYECVIWTKRALAQYGYRSPAKIDLPDLPAGLTDFDLRVYDLAIFRWDARLPAQDEMLLATRFVAGMLGKPKAKNEVALSLRRLRDAGLLRQVRTEPSHFARANGTAIPKVYYALVERAGEGT